MFSKPIATLIGVITGLQLVAVAFALPALPAHVEYIAAVYPKVLVAFANSDRRALGQRTLVLNPVLSQAAHLKAADMAQRDYFAHVSPEGVEPWHWFREVGYRYRAAGENLAVNYYDSQALHRAWMDSPGHRDNILREQFTEIGIGTATGTYNGKPALYVVQMFGAPVEETLNIASPVPAPTMAVSARALMPTALVAASESGTNGRAFLAMALSSPVALVNMLMMLCAVIAAVIAVGARGTLLPKLAFAALCVGGSALFVSVNTALLSASSAIL
jgi:hypothetical protein